MLFVTNVFVYLFARLSVYRFEGECLFMLVVLFLYMTF